MCGGAGAVEVCCGGEVTSCDGAAACAGDDVVVDTVSVVAGVGVGVGVSWAGGIGEAGGEHGSGANPGGGERRGDGEGEGGGVERGATAGVPGAWEVLMMTGDKGSGGPVDGEVGGAVADGDSGRAATRAGERDEGSGDVSGGVGNTLGAARRLVWRAGEERWPDRVLADCSTTWSTRQGMWKRSHIDMQARNHSKGTSCVRPRTILLDTPSPSPPSRCPTRYAVLTPLKTCPPPPTQAGGGPELNAGKLPHATLAATRRRAR